MVERRRLAILLAVATGATGTAGGGHLADAVRDVLEHVEARDALRRQQRGEDQPGLHRQARRIARFHERHDLWLTPTLAHPPPPIGWLTL